LSARAFSALLRRGDWVLDVGSHSGQYSMLAASVVGPNGRVIAIDPNATMNDRVRRNAKLNGFDNVTIVNAAAADFEGQGMLHFSPDPEWASGMATLTEHEGWQPRAVPVTTIDTISGAQEVGALKLDVEGHELEALEGAHRTVDRCHPAVLIEVNGLVEGGWRRTPSLAWLLDHGYQLFGIAASSTGAPQLHRLMDSDDPLEYREPWSALNLVGLHTTSDRGVGLLLD
jgi:FkbM family methyltransferase